MVRDKQNNRTNPRHLSRARPIDAKGGAYTDIRTLIRLRYAVRELDSLVLPKSTNPLAGLLSSKFRGRGIDFAEVRIYQPGDDVRTIDWRVTARMQTPHTKLFQEEKERPVLILVDQSMSMFFGSRHSFKSVIAAEAAALIAWTNLDRGDRVGGIVFNEYQHREVRPRRSKHSVLRLLHEMNDFNHLLSREALAHHKSAAQIQEGENRRASTDYPSKNYLAEALRSVRRVAKHGSTIFLISDYRSLNDQAKIHIRELARHNDIVGIFVTDPLEQSLPAPDLYTITDGTNKAKINTANKQYRGIYEKAFDDYADQLRSEFARIKSPLIEVSTADPIVHSLASRFTEQAVQA
ncbi:MAG: DUF58 domain-containing protein [Pseudomonadales bacterium]